jgi:uncharacterized Zn finger protein
MDTIEFLVQGSAPEPYIVVFKKQANNLSATCTCPAGKIGQHCKHRIRILMGETTGITSKNSEAVQEVQNWLHGTNLQTALDEYIQAERQMEQAKIRLSASKKTLARLLSK